MAQPEIPLHDPIDLFFPLLCPAMFEKGLMQKFTKRVLVAILRDRQVIEQIEPGLQERPQHVIDGGGGISQQLKVTFVRGSTYTAAQHS